MCVCVYVFNVDRPPQAKGQIMQIPIAIAHPLWPNNDRSLLFASIAISIVSHRWAFICWPSNPQHFTVDFTISCRLLIVALFDSCDYNWHQGRACLEFLLSTCHFFYYERIVKICQCFYYCYYHQILLQDINQIIPPLCYVNRTFIDHVTLMFYKLPFNLGHQCEMWKESNES